MSKSSMESNEEYQRRLENDSWEDANLCLDRIENALSTAPITEDWYNEKRGTDCMRVAKEIMHQEIQTAIIEARKRENANT